MYLFYLFGLLLVTLKTTYLASFYLVVFYLSFIFFPFLSFFFLSFYEAEENSFGYIKKKPADRHSCPPDIGH